MKSDKIAEFRENDYNKHRDHTIHKNLKKHRNHLIQLNSKQNHRNEAIKTLQKSGTIISAPESNKYRNHENLGNQQVTEIGEIT